MTDRGPGEGPLDELFWQDEILQVMYWLEGEGIESAVDSAQLARFLSAESQTIAHQMSRLAARGFLALAPGSGGRYQLTDRGREEGGRRFQDEFADLTRPGHGECAPGCWCHDPARAGEPCPSHPDGALRSS